MVIVLWPSSSLREQGYVDGQNTIIETRIYQEALDRLPQLAAELVTLKCDVIVAATPYAINAAMKAKALGLTIPPSLLLRADHVIE